MSIINCSVCIATYKRPDSLNNTLTSLLSCSKVNEILIAITGDKKDSFNYITEYIIESLRLVNKKVIIKDNFSGYISAEIWFRDKPNNDIILILDDDVIVTDSYFNLLDNFEDNKVGAVSGTLQTPCNINYYKDWSNKKLKNIPKEPVNIITFKDNILTIENKMQVYMFEDNLKLLCEVLVGSAMFFRKKLLEPDINFEKEQCYFAEYDYSYNINKKGYKLIFDTSEMAFHNRSNIGGMREFTSDKIKVKKELTTYFRKKWNL